MQHRSSSTLRSWTKWTHPNTLRPRYEASISDNDHSSSELQLRSYKQVLQRQLWEHSRHHNQWPNTNSHRQNSALLPPPSNCMSPRLQSHVRLYLDNSGVSYGQLKVEVNPLSKGAIAGIVIGVAIAVLLTMIGAILVWKRTTRPPLERVWVV